MTDAELAALEQMIERVDGEAIIGMASATKLVLRNFLQRISALERGTVAV